MADELTVEQLRAMASEHDANTGQLHDDQDADATPPAPAQPADQKAVKQDPEAAAQAAEDDTPEPSSDPLKDGKGDTRAQKAGQRLEKTWQAVNEEKQRLAAERAELERLRAEAAQVQAPQQQQPAPALRDNTGRTAEDYRTAARQLAEEGEAELASLAEQKAAELAEQEARAQHEATAEQVKKAWMQSVEETVKEKPELKDPGSELSKAVQALIHETPHFVHIPNGFARAVQIAEGRIATGRVTALESEAKQLREQLEEARRKLSPAGGGASYGSPGNRPLEQLPAHRRKAALLELAAQVDASDS